MNKKVIIIDPLADGLPLDALSWQEFQTFCSDLLQRQDEKYIVREYLTQGNKQDGIDVYVLSGEDLSVAQCKLKKYLSPKDISDMVDDFLGGEFAKKAKAFFLCTSYDLSKHKNREDTIAVASARLDAVGCRLVVWDYQGLTSELRNNAAPQIVYRYFGNDAAIAFYGSAYEDWLSSLRPIEKRVYGEVADYIPRRLTTHQDHQQGAIDPTYLYRKSKYLTLTDQIDESTRSGNGKFLLLSIAGYGKTCELDHLAAHYSKTQEYFFPIRSLLRDYEGQEIAKLLDLFNANWTTISEDSLLLIFDGLDEIRDGLNRTFIDHLNQFCEAKPQVKVVVSTRFNFYNLNFDDLRGFQPLVLQAFNKKDADYYINKVIPGQHNEFNEKIKASRFEEYLSNPYYLSRLVRFYRDTPAEFPATQSDFFEKILFEKFEKDNHKNANLVDRETFMLLAEKIAWSMTYMGQPSLSDEQMERTLGAKSHIDVMKKYFLLNKDGSVNGWSFEHKNLQEYLCACFLMRRPFADIINDATYGYDRTSVQPKFINTLFFLFTLLNENDPKFKDLLNWLIDHEPELLVRFDKNKIPAQSRFDLFKKIVTSYHVKNHTLYNQANFSLQSLAEFVDMDDKAISFIESEIDKDTKNWYVFYGVDLITKCSKPYIYKEQITSIFFKILNDPAYPDDIKANCIRGFVSLNFIKKDLFDKIVSSGINLNDRSIRDSLIHYLNEAHITEEYLDFLIESIPIIARQDARVIGFGSGLFLKQVVLQCQKPGSVKKILQHELGSVNNLLLYGIGDDKLTAEEFAKLMDNAAKFYQADQDFWTIVYRFFAENPMIAFYEPWFTPLRDFFKRTRGHEYVFYELYRDRKAETRLMEFAEKSECDFLIREYHDNKIAKKEMIVYRNVLSHVNRELFEYFYEKINAEFNNEFVIEDKDFDFNAHDKSYIEKNQQMLIDRSLYFAEIDAIFSALGLEAVTSKDFQNYEDYKLRKFRDSIVLHKMRIAANDVPKTSDEYKAGLENETNWENYKIDEIKSLLSDRQRDPARKIEKTLLDYATDWIKKAVSAIDYLHAVTDEHGNTGIAIDDIVYVGDLFQKMDPDLDDALLLKMLPGDVYAGYERSESSLSEMIADKVRDKTKLKLVVFEYLEMELAGYIKMALYALCGKLGYRDCRPLLYQYIIEEKRLDGANRSFLTDIYLTLGGSATDFKSHVKAPERDDKEDYLSWNWYLIDKLSSFIPEDVIQLLLPALADPASSEEVKKHTAWRLILLDRCEGLAFWSEYVRRHGRTPFEHKTEILKSHATEMEYTLALPVLFAAMESYFEKDTAGSGLMRDSITEVVLSILSGIVANHANAFHDVDEDIKRLVEKYPRSSENNVLRRYWDAITLVYYQKSMPVPSLEDACKIFDEAVNDPF